MDDDHPIRFAEAYPFSRPASCFLFRDGGIHPLPAGWRQGGRTPVVAIGANAAPRRLAQKFMAPGEAIPVTRARLHDHAVVFSAHYASYGALPATVWPVEGAVTEVFVTWLDPDQLERMHRSEGVGQRYQVVTLGGVELRTKGHEGIEQAEAYLSEAGALGPWGTPIRLAELHAAGCPFEARSQPAMLKAIWRLLAPDEPYPVFMAEVVSSASFREALRARLAPFALSSPLAKARSASP
jgi:hypothetical protein